MLLRSTAFSLALFVFVVSFHDEEILDSPAPGAALTAIILRKQNILHDTYDREVRVEASC